MNRVYKSGAQKRKLALEKQSKQKEALLKVPKIKHLFSAAAAGPSTANVIAIDESETTSDNELESAVSQSDSQIETEGYEDFDNANNASASKATFGERTDDVAHIPTDPALWSTETDIISLQKYWLEKGR